MTVSHATCNSVHFSQNGILGTSALLPPIGWEFFRFYVLHAFACNRRNRNFHSSFYGCVSCVVSVLRSRGVNYGWMMRLRFGGFRARLRIVEIIKVACARRTIATPIQLNSTLYPRLCTPHRGVVFCVYIFISLSANSAHARTHSADRLYGNCHIIICCTLVRACCEHACACF